MHPYATDSEERKQIAFYIAALSIFLAWGLSRIVSLNKPGFMWWIDAPSTIGIYGLLYYLFDRHLWRWKIWRRLGIVKVPDLNGDWSGHVCSSFDDYNKISDATLKISQHWTHISIVLESERSGSKSQIAAILTKDLNIAILSYEYMNEPLPDAEDTMHMHRGTARLVLKDNGNLLEGDYYTGKGRETFGRLIFGRK
jgi:hypothetical protein